MGNISGTKVPQRFAGLRLTTLALGAALLLATIGGAWTAKTMVALSQREIVTVKLAGLMGEFVEGEARRGATPEETRARIAAYLVAVDHAVTAMGRDGVTVLVAEAVVAGSARDATPELRTAIARQMNPKASRDGK